MNRCDCTAAAKVIYYSKAEALAALVADAFSPVGRDSVMRSGHPCRKHAGRHHITGEAVRTDAYAPQGVAWAQAVELKATELSGRSRKGTPLTAANLRDLRARRAALKASL